MTVAVFLKRILDPEIPATKLRIDASRKDATAAGAAFVMGPYDQNAIEVALQLKDRDPGVRVVAISYGPAESEEILRRALAVGVDEAVLVHDEGGVHDAFHVAEVLAAATRRAGGAEVCLFGLQSGDWDSGQTAFAAAEHLGCTAVSYVSAIEASADGFVVRRVHEGSERIRTANKLVASVMNDGTNALRIAKVKDVLSAKRKPILRLTLGELAVSPADRLELLELIPSPQRASNCRFVEGTDALERARNLARELVASKLVPV